MSPRGCRPVLLVEGEADRIAVPLLIRRVYPTIGHPGCFPASRPIRCGEIPSLRRPGVLEKFVQYAVNRPDGDSVLLIVDCDDDCPVEVASEFADRVSPIAERADKRVGFVFMEREYEVLFLYGIESVETSYPGRGWAISEEDVQRNWSTVRGAKGALGRLMEQSTYKETRDQPAFTDAVDLDRLRAVCRPYQHLESTLVWMLSDEVGEVVYPNLAE